MYSVHCSQANCCRAHFNIRCGRLPDEKSSVNALSRIMRVLFINNNCLLINTRRRRLRLQRSPGSDGSTYKYMASAPFRSNGEAGPIACWPMGLQNTKCTFKSNGIKNREFGVHNRPSFDCGQFYSVHMYRHRHCDRRCAIENQAESTQYIIAIVCNVHSGALRRLVPRDHYKFIRQARITGFVAFVCPTIESFRLIYLLQTLSPGSIVIEANFGAHRSRSFESSFVHSKQKHQKSMPSV